MNQDKRRLVKRDFAIVTRVEMKARSVVLRIFRLKNDLLNCTALLSSSLLSLQSFKLVKVWFLNHRINFCLHEAIESAWFCHWQWNALT